MQVSTQYKARYWLMVNFSSLQSMLYEKMAAISYSHLVNIAGP